MSNKNSEQKKYHTFRIGRIPKYDPTKVSFEVSPEANLYEAIETFERFLRAVGYVLPVGGHLDIVFEDMDPVEDLPEEDLTLGDFKDAEPPTSGNLTLEDLTLGDFKDAEPPTSGNLTLENK